jgi:hypothetical protein
MAILSGSWARRPLERRKRSKCGGKDSGHCGEIFAELGNFCNFITVKKVLLSIAVLQILSLQPVESRVFHT